MSPRKVDLSGIPPEEREFWRGFRVSPKGRLRGVIYEDISERRPAGRIIEAKRCRTLWQHIWPPGQSILAAIGRIYAYIAIVILAWITLVVIV